MTVHVQGTSRRVLKADGGRQGSAAGVPDEPWFEPSGFLLDLVTDADTEAASLRRLAEAAAVVLTQAVGVQIDCAVMLAAAQAAPVRAANNGRAAGLGYLEQDLDGGPMKQAAAAESPIVVEAAETTLRWQAYRRRFLDAGYGEVVAVPLRLDPGTTAALAFFAPPEVRFDPGTISQATWFARVASQSLKLALEVQSVRSAGDNLKALLEGRTSIDVACGVIMGRNRCSYPDAFGLLAGASTQRNKQVREVAEGFLKNLPKASAGMRFEF
ncbi:ANTAR domain-containing protein [Arthrobacter sp. SLBN-100]|uniref:ANTAR domain-containing protein n=1 Tax=Arthrobacter sp. SLBN-100 TaxID=2768450 RepID=UPI0011530F7D|nr:ANTAR domain-containing protein [Arthrobacter sp. SLBN-100]TQJ67666.1 ANTAR domain-containing protein [Arthrobacter sp. SLBN-100]